MKPYMRFTLEPKYIALLFALFGFIYILAVTGNYNLGISPDSVLYIEVARNIAEGKGITRQLTNGEYTFVSHWPPLYPISLASMSKLTGLSVLEAGRYYAALVIFLNIIVANLLFNKLVFTKRKLILLNILLVTSLAFGIHLQFWSEPLFLLFFLSACYFIFLWFDTQRLAYVLVSAIFSGFLFLTRYAGIGLIGGIILYLLFRKGEIKQKIKHAALYTLISMGIFSIWIIVSVNYTTHPTNRDIVFHLFSLQHGIQLVGNIARWISPAFTITGTILIGSLMMLLIFKEHKQNKNLISNVQHEKSMLIIFITITYLCFLVLSVSFVDFHTPISSRVLSPIYPLVIVWVVALLEKMSLTHKKLYFAILSLILFSYLYHFYDRSLSFYERGSGFTGKTWIDSETMNFLMRDGINDDVAIYTNGSDAIQSLIKRNHNMYDLPKKLRAGTQVENPDFAQEIEKLKTSLEKNSSMIVYFDSITWRYYFPEKKFIKNEFQEFDTVELNDGLVISNKKP